MSPWKQQCALTAGTTHLPQISTLSLESSTITHIPTFYTQNQTTFFPSHFLFHNSPQELLKSLSYKNQNTKKQTRTAILLECCGDVHNWKGKKQQQACVNNRRTSISLTHTEVVQPTHTRWSDGDDDQCVGWSVTACIAIASLPLFSFFTLSLTTNKNTHSHTTQEQKKHTKYIQTQKHTLLSLTENYS